MDLHIDTDVSKDGSALEVACPAPGHGEISGNFWERIFGTYRRGYIRDETRGMDLHNGIGDSSNSSALKVVCSPPGHREKSQESSGDHHSSTYGGSSVGIEGRIKDDKCSIRNVDSPTIL
jgi:hypothetical protein